MASALHDDDGVYFAIGGILLQETDEAILLRVLDDEVWLPKSQIEYDDGAEIGDYLEAEATEWICRHKGLEDGQGIERPASAATPQAEEPANPQDDTVKLDLFIDNILDDGELLIVEPTGKYNDDGLLEAIDKSGQTFEILASAVSTDEAIKIGATISCGIKMPDAIKAGLVDPPRQLGEKSTWLKRDTIPHSFPLTDAEKIDLARQMAETQASIGQLEVELAETRKNLKGQIDMLQARMREAVRIFNSGKADPVPVKCDVIQDWTTDELVWVSANDEAIEIFRRKMTPEEKRPTLIQKAPRNDVQ